MSQFKDMNVQDLLASLPEGFTSPTQNEDPEGPLVWTEEQKQEMNKRMAMSRLQYRKTQMRSQRGGQGRYELRKRQLGMGAGALCLKAP